MMDEIQDYPGFIRFKEYAKFLDAVSVVKNEQVRQVLRKINPLTEEQLQQSASEMP